MYREYNIFLEIAESTEIILYEQSPLVAIFET
jgi:hypothetical protein